MAVLSFNNAGDNTAAFSGGRMNDVEERNNFISTINLLWNIFQAHHKAHSIAVGQECPICLNPEVSRMRDEFHDRMNVILDSEKRLLEERSGQADSEEKI